MVYCDFATFWGKAKDRLASFCDGGMGYLYSSFWNIQILSRIFCQSINNYKSRFYFKTVNSIKISSNLARKSHFSLTLPINCLPPIIFKKIIDLTQSALVGME